MVVGEWFGGGDDDLDTPIGLRHAVLPVRRPLLALIACTSEREREIWLVETRCMEEGGQLQMCTRSLSAGTQ